MPVATPELVDFSRRYLTALVARDTKYLSDTSLDEPDCRYLGIGSLPDEQWDLPHLLSHLAEFPPTTLVGSEPTGYYNDDVAWMVDFPGCELPDGSVLPLRITLVLRRVDGGWKAVHWHFSEGVARSLDM
jgi:SnoaL-like protein